MGAENVAAVLLKGLGSLFCYLFYCSPLGYRIEAMIEDTLRRWVDFLPESTLLAGTPKF